MKTPKLPPPPPPPPPPAAPPPPPAPTARRGIARAKAPSRAVSFSQIFGRMFGAPGSRRSAVQKTASKLGSGSGLYK
jgi:hypothetical protein